MLGLYGDASRSKISMCVKLLNGIFIGGTLIQLGEVLIYLCSCELHYYQRVLQVCQSEVNGLGEVSWSHGSTWTMIPFSIFHLLASMEQVVSIYAYFAFLIPAVFLGLDMRKALM